MVYLANWVSVTCYTTPELWFFVMPKWNNEAKFPMMASFSSLPLSTSLAFAELVHAKKMCVPEPLSELSLFFQCAPAKIVWEA